MSVEVAVADDGEGPRRPQFRSTGPVHHTVQPVADKAVTTLKRARQGVWYGDLELQGVAASRHYLPV